MLRRRSGRARPYSNISCSSNHRSRLYISKFIFTVYLMYTCNWYHMRLIDISSFLVQVWVIDAHGRHVINGPCVISPLIHIIYVFAWIILHLILIWVVMRTLKIFLNKFYMASCCVLASYYVWNKSSAARVCIIPRGLCLHRKQHYYEKAKQFKYLSELGTPPLSFQTVITKRKLIRILNQGDDSSDIDPQYTLIPCIFWFS